MIHQTQLPIPYKAEFFDRDFNFKLFSVIPEPEIKLDYLTLDKSSIKIPSLDEISRGWYCRITQGKNVIHQGIVASTSQSKSTSTIQLSPMVSLFDIQIYKNINTYKKSNLEGWMADTLSENFIDSYDSVQNITGFTVEASTSTNDIALNLTDNIHDFWSDIAVKAIENAKIAISCSFDPQIKAVTAVIKSYADQSEITIEADLPNVIDQYFSLRDDWGSTNKCVIINKEDESQQLSFYADDYTAPTVCKIEMITVGNDETFQDAAKDKADELLKKSDFDNLIELQFRSSDRIIPDIEIGRPCRIIKNGTVYHTVLTGITKKSGFKTLIFGGVRIDLTKILKLKGAI